jgi:hypothetical protein
MHYGSKGWYVEELKKKGITHYEGRFFSFCQTFGIVTSIKRR